MRSLSDLFRNFVQLGYVTDDIDAAASYLESAMGTGKCVKSYTSSLGGGRPPPARASGVPVSSIQMVAAPCLPGERVAAPIRTPGPEPGVMPAMPESGRADADGMGRQPADGRPGCLQPRWKWRTGAAPVR
jgi:hypothetical protein